MPCFNLTKWYADAAWPGGGEILYRARLGQGRIGLAARVAPGRRMVRPVSWTAAEPAAMEGGLVFPAVAGWPAWRWQGEGVPPLVLHEDESVRAQWQVVVRTGSVTGAGIPGPALGYAECLRLTGWPWRLGLQRLFWGRFCGPAHSLVWIIWEGRINRRWCFLDGQPRDGLSVTLPDQIRAEGVRLDLAPQEGLVDEPLRGLFGGIRLPGPAGRFLSGRERKWTGPARLTGDVEEEGSVIHEVVQWN